MRVLFVTPWVPSVLRPRSAAMLDVLSQDHDVHLLALYRNDDERAQAANLPCRSVTLVRNTKVRSMGRLARGVLRRDSLQASYADVPEFRHELARLVHELSPDIVHLNVFRTLHLLPGLAATATVIDLDEFRSEYYRQLRRAAGNPVWRCVGWYESRAMSAGEAQLVASGRAIAVSGSVAAWSDSPNVREIPSAVTTRGHACTPRAASDTVNPQVLFVGRFTYEANVDAVTWFVSNCWDRILGAVPTARLQLVGDGPPKQIRALASESITVTGFVPTTEPYYRDARVAVVPVRRATGVQMKLIEAMQAGLPTVCSPIVAALAGVRDQREVLVADTADQWVAAVVRLLRNPESARSLGDASQVYANERYSMAELRRRVSDWYATAKLGADPHPPTTQTTSSVRR